MYIDTYLDRCITTRLIEANVKEQEGRTPSGKLSAGKLAWPLQWQILNKLGVPPAPFDEYTLRKFKRGKDVEEWLLSLIPGVVDTQKFREYRDVIGFEDSLVDTSAWDKSFGVIPLEVKSVTNLKFKKIKQQGADRSHKLQNALYALAENREHFAIAYVASDDYRLYVPIYKTQDYKEEIDKIIDRYIAQGDVVPVFKAEEVWQASPKYNSYPEWIDLTEEQIAEKLNQIKHGTI